MVTEAPDGMEFGSAIVNADTKNKRKRGSRTVPLSRHGMSCMWAPVSPVTFGQPSNQSRNLAPHPRRSGQPCQVKTPRPWPLEIFFGDLTVAQLHTQPPPSFSPPVLFFPGVLCEVIRTNTERALPSRCCPSLTTQDVWRVNLPSESLDSNDEG